MQGYADHDLAAVVLYAAFRRREEHAGCDRAVRGDECIECAYVREATVLILCGGCNEEGVICHNVVSNVDNLCELAYLSVRIKEHLIIEREAALVRYLDVADLGITGLPIFVKEDRAGRVILCVLPIYVVFGPVHTDIEITTLNDVTAAGNRVCEPCVGGAEKHCYTEYKCYGAGD